MYTNEQGVWKLILTWRAGILIQFKFVIRFLASEASQKKILDFGDADNEFWLHYWRQIIFFTVPLSNIIFFSQNQSKEFFFRKNSKPPPEYQMDRA